jgi:hypothetical protein
MRWRRTELALNSLTKKEFLLRFPPPKTEKKKKEISKKKDENSKIGANSRFSCAENKVLPKVGGLQTGRSSLGDVEDVLEMLVERVEQAVTEAPEEEEDGDESDGPDGLANSELGGVGHALVRDLEGALLEELLDAHGGSGGGDAELIASSQRIQIIRTDGELERARVAMMTPRVVEEELGG